MKGLLRLYPRSWRKRYGREMEVLLEDTPDEIGVGLDLVRGAGVAYAAVIRRNRILSAAGSFLNAVGVAALLQAIAFVLFVLVARNSPGAKYLAIGPFALAELWYPGLLSLGGGIAVDLEWLLALALLLTLLGALAFALTAPRLARSAVTSPAKRLAARRPDGALRRRRDRRGPRSRSAF